ncbi:hypothetical protein [Aurantiacibacter sp. D1-12]|uniref:hypothetical protein n=1 Tax=Aurantiacibacter sp. D1-12 TaxID=2993658 RepID=UPI00237D10CB|nr:hypothetical protein [Aurantiacibacter sp. D1-12]MDE1467894.1 hypothetical protein [Aurantiacibacter sp. D1-12]
MSDEDMALLRETLPGMTEECLNIVRYEGIEAYPNDTGRCFEMSEQRRWKGLWIAEFEYSVFCGPDGMACYPDEAEEATDTVWLSFASGAEQDDIFPNGFAYDSSSDGIYEIEFLGRITSIRGSHGHMGMSQREIVVSEVISIELVDD